MSERHRRCRGSAVIELVLAVPILLMFVDLGVAGGRHAQAQALADAAAHGAARAASEARTVAGATGAADAAAAASLNQAGPSCATYTVSVDTSAFHAGGTVSVDVQCQTSLSDLTSLPLPGSMRLVGHSVSPIDVFRSAA
ncbi:MAG: TadE family protein [Candidatus Aeolococcus gillhamiae]|uniref:TadE family protein n=1 Tax=Candidatus Aeolococcus gillhamiae TaxID=3127015 RepID=A0A2W5Z4H0_9BACT|nr:MAG: TadE family protein [Candidatus Dormibacter sp. RRmetagenome_bin12]